MRYKTNKNIDFNKIRKEIEDLLQYYDLSPENKHTQRDFLNDLNSIIRKEVLK